jgi:molybdopterin converting factor subunit 1
MQVTIRLFAADREAAGRSSFVANVPNGSTIADVYRRVIEEHPGIGRSARAVAFALNREHASADAPVRDGDELAILPPVAGG